MLFAFLGFLKKGAHRPGCVFGPPNGRHFFVRGLGSPWTTVRGFEPENRCLLKQETEHAERSTGRVGSVEIR
jgi:hypothetical protein